MKTRFLIACLAALALSAQAYPIDFQDVQFDVTAIAAGDGAPGFDAQSSPPLSTPVSASASSGNVDFTTAGAIAGPGLLSASADAAGGGGIASAVATSHFAGTFLNNGEMHLSLDFLSLALASDSGSAETSLFVLLVSDGVTLFDDYVSGPWQFSYNANAGTMSTLDLTLTSQASAGFPDAGLGNASAFGLVTFAGSVPEAPTLMLLPLAVGAMVAVRRRTRRAVA